MAFNPTNAADSSNNSGSFEKALGFINVALPSMNGGTTKLGTLTLKASDSRQKELFDALNKGDEQIRNAILQAIAQKLVLDFRSAEKDPGKSFDLGIDLAALTKAA